MRKWKSSKVYLITMVVILFIGLIGMPILALDPQPEPPAPQVVTLTAADKIIINNLSSTVHRNFRTSVRDRNNKPIVNMALARQVNFLRAQPAVKTAVQQPDGNIFVEFKNGYKLLMMLGDRTFGTLQEFGFNGGTPNPPSNIPSVPKTSGSSATTPPVVTTPPLTPIVSVIIPSPPRALIFDCLEDQSIQVRLMDSGITASLKSLGFSITKHMNDDATLKTAAQMNDDYKVIFFCAHGGVYNNDYYFMVRPWYTSPPPMNSGYTGTIVACADNWKTGRTEYGYCVGSQFASTYWSARPFPGTIWTDCACNSMGSPNLKLPQWVIDHGSNAWTGWNGALSLPKGPTATQAFINYLSRDWNTLSEAAAKVKTTLSYPLIIIKPVQSGNERLPRFFTDPDEPGSPDQDDFAAANLQRKNNQLNVEVAFRGQVTANGFMMYADNNNNKMADICVNCTPTQVKAFKMVGGVPKLPIYTGVPTVQGNIYKFTLPYNKQLFGQSSKPTIWFVDPTSKDRMPNQ